VLLVLGAVAVGVTVYVRDQYYVGFDGDDVAVFRGVQGSVAGLPFHSVAEKSVLRRSQLSEVEADRVADGIPAASRQDAHAIVERLIGETQCAPARPTPATSGTPAPTPTALSTGTPAPSTTPSTSPAPCP
jgi:protein phosphatase